ncbi:Tyrosine recombinase XerC [Alphaproteobacteria bacterium SO-S41]|nr:Tyrosine recombinase XerC [Alphaproteobacteria bacterium SO-S41]
MAVGRITKRAVDALQPGDQLFDSSIRGFMVRAYANRKVYGLKYISLGKQRIFTIGEHGERTPDGESLTPENARSKAQSLRGQIAAGKDPQADKAADRDGKRAAPTISAVCDRYLAEHVKTHNRASTAREIKVVIENRIKPEFGSCRIGELSRARIKEWHSSMSATPYGANRCLAYLQKMMSLASGDWELRPDNPCVGIKRFPEKKRERFFGEPELASIGNAISGIEEARLSEEHPVSESAIALLRFLALTGMRLTEARTLRWKEVDLSGPTLHLSEAKAGSRSIPLGAPAAVLLSSLPKDSDFVFRRAGSNAPESEAAFRKLWARVREITGIQNARPHDLRHTLGTYTAQTGANAFVVRDLLGHRTMAMTGRYVERAVDPLRATADTTAGRISAAMAGKTAEIIRIDGQRIAADKKA